MALLVTSALLVLLQWRTERAPVPTNDSARAPGGQVGGRSVRRQLTTVAALAVVAAVACGVQVYRVGDSGARAAWGDTPAASSGGK